VIFLLHFESLDIDLIITVQRLDASKLTFGP